MRYLIAATLIVFGCSDGAKVRDAAPTQSPQQKVNEGHREETGVTVQQGVRAPSASATSVSTSDGDNGGDEIDDTNDANVLIGNGSSGKTRNDQAVRRAPSPAPAASPAPAPAPAQPASDGTKPFDAAGLANGNCSLNGVATLAPGTGVYTHMQGFTGAIGGNPVGMTSDGTAQFSYHSRIATAPLDLTRMVDSRASAVVYAKKLDIPAGKSFRLKRIRFRACVGWDSNGFADFALTANGVDIKRFAYDNTKPAIIVPPTSLDLDILLPPGAAGALAMSFSNSSMAEVIAEGQVE